MTICLAAVCADDAGEPGRAAVVASDRMVTFGGIMEFEHEVPKILLITDRVVALNAGDTLRGSRLAREVAPAIQGSTPTVNHVADVAAECYARLR